MREPKEIAQIIEDNISISNSAFLKNAGLPGTTIANMKSGSMPSADKLGKIAEALGISIDYLLGIKENATDNDAGRKQVFISYSHGAEVFADNLAKVLAQLSDDDLKQVYNYALFLSEQAGQDR